MPERTETGYEVFPETKDLLLTMTKPAEKGKTAKGKYYYIFRGRGVVDGKTRGYSEALMTWMAGDLLRALGCKEVSKGVFEWEKEEIVGRQIMVDIVHEPDFKDPSKPTAKMRNIRPVAAGGGEEPPAVLPADPERDLDMDQQGIPF